MTYQVRDFPLSGGLLDYFLRYLIFGITLPPVALSLRRYLVSGEVVCTSFQGLLVDTWSRYTHKKSEKKAPNKSRARPIHIQ